MKRKRRLLVQRGLDLQFPPVNSGGLIEATFRTIFANLRDLFPPVNSGGLIEATWTTYGSLGRQVGFPPVNSGGLIEATGPGHTASAAPRGFRR